MARKNVELRGIAGFTRYMATSEGKVVLMGEYRDCGEDREIKPHKSKDGCLLVNVEKESGANKTQVKIGLAKLVAIAFHGSPPTEGTRVKHRDNDQRNNRPENLYWSVPVAYTQSPGVTEKPIPGIRGYWASSSGQIIQMPAQLIVAPRNGAVSLRIDGKLTSRSVAHLVALAFIGKPPEGFGPKQVYAKHRDGDKANNAASNLYWRTPETKVGAK